MDAEIAPGFSPGIKHQDYWLQPKQIILVLIYFLSSSSLQSRRNERNYPTRFRDSAHRL